MTATLPTLDGPPGRVRDSGSGKPVTEIAAHHFPLPRRGLAGAVHGRARAGVDSLRGIDGSRETDTCSARCGGKT